MKLNDNLKIPTTLNVSVQDAIDYIIDQYQFKGEKLFQVVKSIIEETDNSWEKRLNAYFRSKK